MLITRWLASEALAHYSLLLGECTVTLSVGIGLADKACCSIRFMLIPLWLLVKNAEGEDVFGRHSRTEEQTKDEARASRLDIGWHCSPRQPF